MMRVLVKGRMRGLACFFRRSDRSSSKDNLITNPRGCNRFQFSAISHAAFDTTFLPPLPRLVMIRSSDSWGLCLYKNPVAVILCTTPQSIRLLCVDGTFYTPTDNVSGSIWSCRIRRVYTYLLIDCSHLSTSATYNLQSTGLFDYWNQIRISVLYMQIDMIDLDVLIMSRCTIGFYWWMTRLQQKIYGR